MNIESAIDQTSHDLIGTNTKNLSLNVTVSSYQYVSNENRF